MTEQSRAARHGDIPEAPARLRRQQLDRNLAALAEVDAALAERLRRVRAEDHLTPAVGRDGHVTLRRSGPDGRVIWHGRTSMPTVSAPALLERFDLGTGNVAFHGFGHGLEAALLLDRLAPHQTLFVLESDPVAAVGALLLHDLRGAIRRRSLVPLVGDSPRDQLIRFLTENPGFDPPERFLQWPWRDPHEIQRFKLDLESLHTALAAERSKAVARIAPVLRSLGTEASAKAPARCLVISRRPCLAAETMLAALASADGHAREAPDGRRWEVATVNGHRPGQASALGMATAIERSRPQFVILLNELRGPLRALIPERIPVVSWFADPRHAAAIGAARPGENDRVFADSPRTAEVLVQSGIAAERVRVLPPAGPVEPAGRSAGRGNDGADGGGADGVVIADGVDSSAAGMGIELGTMALLWEGMVSVVKREPERVHGGGLEWALGAAERHTGVRITDARVRAGLAARLEFEAAEAILARHYIGALRNAGLRVRLWGRGWEDDPLPAPCPAGRLPEDEARWRVLAGSKVAVDCAAHERIGPWTFAAVRAGCVPMVRSSVSKRGQDPSRLGLPIFMTAKELVRKAGKLIEDSPGRQETIGALRERIEAEHLATHRLVVMAKSVAQGQ